MTWRCHVAAAAENEFDMHVFDKQSKTKFLQLNPANNISYH